MLKGRGGDRTEHLGWRWRAWSGPGPTLVELDKKERVFEGPPVDDSLHQVDEGHNHEADEEEGDKWPQMVPSHHAPIAHAADPALLPSVGSVTG